MYDLAHALEAGFRFSPILASLSRAGDARLSAMKVPLLALLTVLSCQTQAVAGIGDIPETNQVVLADGDWKPPAEETQKALAAIQAFLEGSGYTNDWSRDQLRRMQEHDPRYFDWLKSRIRTIQDQAKKYRVKFLGMVSGG